MNINESNVNNCFLERKLANTFLKKRKRDLESNKSPKVTAKETAKGLEKDYNISFDNFFLKIKSKYKYINKIEIILSLNMDMNQYFPILDEGYGYIFLNNSQDGLIFNGKTKNSEKYITLSSKNEDNFLPLQINSHINIKEKFPFFIVKLD